MTMVEGERGKRAGWKIMSSQSMMSESRIIFYGFVLPINDVYDQS